MSSGSKSIPGIMKARAWKKRVETMITELNLFKEFTICSVDEISLQCLDAVGWAAGKASCL